MKKSIQSIVIITIISTILLFSFHRLELPPHIPLIVCISLLIIYGYYKKIDVNELEDSMVDSISQALKAVFMLSLVGILISSWMMSGTVATILFYGVKYINPKWFYVSCILICMIASSFNGSAITIAPTLGVGLLGISESLGLPSSMTVGAIICGSCFGDKCSPLSETTNLAPGILNVDLFEHVKNLIWTTIPAMLVTILIFAYHGMNAPHSDIGSIAYINNTIQEYYNISIWNLLPPIVVFALAIKRINPNAVFIAGIVAGLIITALIQKDYDIVHWANVMQDGFKLKTTEGPGFLTKLVNKGGLQSMMWTISLVLIALSLGGILKRLGIIQDVLSLFSKRLTSKGPLVFAASMACILVNFITGEQFLSIVLPGKAFMGSFKKYNVPLKFLSRTLEDCGTLINPLVPWGVAGAIYSGALGVSVKEYAPYAYFLFISPIFTIIFGFLNIENFILRIFKKK